MVGTIGSVGYGASEKSGRTKWRRLFGSYLAGSVVGGAMLGIGLGFAGLILEAGERASGTSGRAADVIGATLLLLLASRDLGLAPIPIPSRHRQVPMGWKRLPGLWSPFLFGLALGTGVTTTIYLASFYALAIVAVLARNLGLALLLGLAYASARTIVVWQSAHSERGPEVFTNRLAPRAQLIAAANGLAAGAVALALLTSAG
jgi:hypothetical protein